MTCPSAVTTTCPPPPPGSGGRASGQGRPAEGKVPLQTVPSSRVSTIRNAVVVGAAATNGGHGDSVGPFGDNTRAACSAHATTAHATTRPALFITTKDAGDASNVPPIRHAGRESNPQPSD